MKRTAKKLLSVLLALTMALALVPAYAATDDANETLWAAADRIEGSLSPFYAPLGANDAAVKLTQISLAGCDRAGQMVINGINGEYRTYNGSEYFYKGIADLDVSYDHASDTTTYTASIRHDLTFSDGVPVTADDVIFTYYVLLDSDYYGPNILNTYPIQGVREYRTQTTQEVYNELMAMAVCIYGYGSDHVCDGAEPFTQEQYEAYWQLVFSGWELVCRGIVDYVVANYGIDAYVQSFVDPALTADTFLTTEGNRVAYAMALWGYGEFSHSGSDLIFTDSCGTSYNLSRGKGPGVADFVRVTRISYGDDADMFYNCDGVGGDIPNPRDRADEQFVIAFGPELMGGEVITGISGIRRVNDWCVEVIMDGYSAHAAREVFGVCVAPMHYYGDTSMYNYQQGQYGFPRGDLSMIRAKNDSPLGAGPYKFISYGNGVAAFERNENYYLGLPKIKRVGLVETDGSYSDRIALVEDGSVDVCEIGLDNSAVELINNANSGGITGSVITTVTTPNNGYGYIGMNADTVNVGGYPGSPASMYLRRGFATVIALCRYTAVEEYFGPCAEVIEYPYCVWATPQPGDDGYQKAFSKDINGNDIYLEGMTLEQMEDAAIEAAKAYFIAAGFTFGADGRVVSVPEGASASYEAIVPGYGSGAHPAYGVFVKANELLSRMGFGIEVNDVDDSNYLWDALDSGAQQMWAAAWGASDDPDLYQVYHSSNIVLHGGSDSNHYHIQSPDLDALIIEARRTVDLDMRKALYKQCLDIIMDWAVNIPVYQRNNAVLFSTERVDVGTAVTDPTEFYGWMEEIHKLKLAGASSDLPGDVNGDGVVNANDALLVLRFTLGIVTEIGPEADVNGDGVVNANDALLILRAVLGIVAL